MPSHTWMSWKKVLSCNKLNHQSVYDPAKLKEGTKCNKNGSAKKKRKKRRDLRDVSSSVCCSDSIKQVINCNDIRVLHRSDNGSPLHQSNNNSSPLQLRELIKMQEPVFQPSSSCKSVQDDSTGDHLPIAPEEDIKEHVKKSLQVTSDEVPELKTGSSTGHLPGSNAEEASLLYKNNQGSFKVAELKKLSELQYHQSLFRCNGSSLRSSISAHVQSTCQDCGEEFDTPASYEEHHLTYHSVTELREDDSARSIVEIIFQTSWLRSDIPCAKPEKIFKVHNSSKTVAKFEAYRDMVKGKADKANKPSRKHSRCMVDGNELLRFYGTTVSCNIGRSRSSLSTTSASTTSNSSAASTASSCASPLSSMSVISMPYLCTSPSCGACSILRHGFPAKSQSGVYTTASSGRAHVPCDDGESKQAMLVCRVIAGRVKKMNSEDSQDGSSSGYDSIGEPGPFSSLEELLVFNNSAVLPCFIVVYNC